MLIFTIKRIFCIVISFINILSMSLDATGSVHNFFRKQLNSFVESADVSIIANPLKTYQTVTGFGTSACWWSQDVGASENAEEVARLLYSDDGLALNIYRYNVGAGEKENPNSRIAGNRATESFYFYNKESGEYEYDFSRDAAAQKVLDLSMSYGNIDTIVLFANSPHYSMTVTGQATGGYEEYFSNLPPENYEAFADYMLTIAEHFIDEGYPVKYISPINEPQWSWGGDWVGQEGCHFETDEIVALMKVFALKIKESGLDVKLMAPESGEVSDVTLNWFDLLASDPDIAEVLGSLAYHSYWTDGNAHNKYYFGQSLAQKNYPCTVDMTEWCELPLGHDITDFGGAMREASVISQDLLLSGANSWSAWSGVNNYSVDKNGLKWSDGLLAMNDNASEINVCERYYALAHFSKFIPAGSVRIGASADVWDLDYQKGWDGEVYDAQLGFSASAYKTPNGEIVLVLVNEGKTRNFTINALSFKLNMDVYQSTADMKLKNTYSGLICPIISVPSNSITTVVLH
ncbi:MAG: glycoside hydrolase family 30 protein [Oscillospiraceae bacterium]|nr:glycoside hydrolase family 30 protein [Oscillospiraceae bacterium]